MISSVKLSVPVLAIITQFAKKITSIPHLAVYLQQSYFLFLFNREDTKKTARLEMGIACTILLFRPVITAFFPVSL